MVLIYTMDVTEELINMLGCDRHIDAGELLLSIDTLQYNDYNQYESEIFNKEAKVNRHAEAFPEDCKRAFEVGVRMASGRIHKPELMASFEW
jgi:hypothetical protein